MSDCKCMGSSRSWLKRVTPSLRPPQSPSRRYHSKDRQSIEWTRETVITLRIHASHVFRKYGAAGCRTPPRPDAANNRRIVENRNPARGNDEGCRFKTIPPPFPGAVPIPERLVLFLQKSLYFFHHLSFDSPFYTQYPFLWSTADLPSPIYAPFPSTYSPCHELYS